MAGVFRGRYTAQIDGPFVVFVIGMRINQFWKIWRWLPTLMAMQPMLVELYTHPEKGFLGAEFSVNLRGPVSVQYWRSFDQLEAYARSKDGAHWPAWVAFNKRTRYSSGDVGIWHETYRVAAGQYETVYGSMPAVGLGKAAGLVPATGKRDAARGRLGGGLSEASPVDSKERVTS
jgi:hypothetical protein